MMLHRRTLLRSAGVALALPQLEAMASTDPSPRRLVFICTSLGLHSPNLWPQRQGTDYEATKYLGRLSQYRDEFTLFAGLSHEDQNGRQPHDSELTWLTAARKPGMGGFRNTISVDQVAADHFRGQTRFASLTLGSMKTQSQSYTSSGVMVPAQTSPASVFAQLFLRGRPDEVQAQKRRLSDGQSVLDHLGSQVNQVRKRSSQTDHHLLEDYLESVRAAERDMQLAQSWADRPKPSVETQPPKDIQDPTDMIGRTRLLMSLVPLALQTDSTRVVSVMVQDHLAVPKVEGVTVAHHNLSHHGQDPQKIDQLERIETGIIDCFGELLSSLQTTNESGNRLLDQTRVLFGSNLGNANAHLATNLPIFVAGGGYNHGRFIDQRREGNDQPLSDLFVRLLQDSGIEIDQFGQSESTISW